MESFLEELESRLSLLDEQERKKVIKKYQSQIEGEKENGKSEKEILSALKPIDEIVEDIYEDYHINKEYSKREKSRNPINRGIEAGAKALAEITEDIIYYINRPSGDNALETFFELLLKILVLLLTFMILKLPFWLLNEAGIVVLDGLFYPFNTALTILLKFVLSILYFAVCVALGIYLFKENIKKPSKTVSEKVEDRPIKKGKKAKKQTDYLVFFLRVIIYVIAFIPLLLIAFILCALLAFAVFLIYKGVSIAGLAIVLLGYFFLSVLLIAYLTDALNHKTKSHRFSLIVSLLALLVGHILLVDNIFSFHYPKTLESSAFKPFTESTTISLKNDMYIQSLTGKIEKVVDNSLKDDELIVEMTYYDELYDVVLRTSQEEEVDYLILYPIADEREYYDVQYLYQNILEDLKKNNIFDYDKLDTVDVKVYGTETALARILE